MRQRGRLLLLQLFDRPRLRPDRAGGRLRARLPADRRGAGLRRAAAAEEDPPHRDHRPMSWPSTPAELEQFGQTLVANGAGLFTSYEVAFGDLSLTAQLPRI